MFRNSIISKFSPLVNAAVRQSIPKPSFGVRHLRKDIQFPAAFKFSSTLTHNHGESAEPSPGNKMETKRMIIGFTCKVCQTRQEADLHHLTLFINRSFKQMSKVAYEKGVVIIKCDGCKNKHLISGTCYSCTQCLTLDHLGWFDSQKKVGSIEDIMREKGEHVKRLTFDPSCALPFAQATSDQVSSPSSSTSSSQEGNPSLKGVVEQKDGDMLEWLPDAVKEMDRQNDSRLA